MKLNIPICLTIFRIILIPFFMIAFYIPGEWSAFFTALIFLIAAVTDWFDGYLARKLGQTTSFGAFLDPVADKVIVAIALVLIVQHYNTWFITIPTIVIISREFVISALREWMAQIGGSAKVAVSNTGKLKTLSQMTAITWLLWRPNDFVIYAGIAAIYFATILSFWSMMEYLFAAFKGSKII